MLQRQGEEEDQPHMTSGLKLVPRVGWDHSEETGGHILPNHPQRGHEIGGTHYQELVLRASPFHHTSSDASHDPLH